MRSLSIPAFTTQLHKTASPLSLSFELTDACALSCKHCYWRGVPRLKRPLPEEQAKDILEQAAEAGTLWVSFTGGDPLIHPEFPEIYLHAKKLGLVTTIFTSGVSFNEKLFSLLRKAPPYCVEITLNGSRPQIQEAVSGVKGSFRKIVNTVRRLKKYGIPVTLKANLMTLNASDMANIKKLAHRLLGESGRYLHPFQYDPNIHIALSGCKSPTDLRLSFPDFMAAIDGDAEMRKEMQTSLRAPKARLERPAKYKYLCAGRTGFTVTPDGFLQYCSFEKAYRRNLRKVPFAKAAREISAAITGATLPASSKCRNCKLRASCGWCPARARLETGREGPVPFLCQYTEDLYAYHGKLKQESTR